MFFRKFNTLETTKVFLKAAGESTVYPLDVTPEGISWAQTFTEKTYKTKTIENQSFLREKGVFKKANPASFSFIVPLTKENHAAKKVFDLLVETPSNTLKSFTLWFIDLDKSISLETCVITSGTFGVNSGQVITLSVEGEAGKLRIFNRSAFGNTITNIIKPGSVDFGNISGVPTNAPTFTYSDISEASSRNLLTVDNVAFAYGTSINNSIPSRLLSLSIEIQNKVNWVPHQTLNGSISASNANNIEYPSEFVLEGQSLAGNIRTVIANTNSQSSTVPGISDDITGENQQFIENSDFIFNVYGVAGGSTPSTNGTPYGISFAGTSGCVNVTKTIEAGPFWTASHNWRVTGNNTSALSSLLTYTTA
jgi:hypothetical protein